MGVWRNGGIEVWKSGGMRYGSIEELGNIWRMGE